jgi:hypothetical protein
MRAGTFAQRLIYNWFRMPDPTPIPFLRKGLVGRSVIVGAPANFDFLTVLKSASAVRLAVAFGHLSGWKEIEDALVHSSAVVSFPQGCMKAARHSW